MNESFSLAIILIFNNQVSKTISLIIKVSLKKKPDSICPAYHLFFTITDPALLSDSDPKHLKILLYTNNRCHVQLSLLLLLPGL